MNPLLEDIEYKDNGTPAKTIFKSLIFEDEAFVTILGCNEQTVYELNGEYRVSTQQMNFPFYDSNHYLFVEDGIAKGFIGIKENRMDFFRKEVLVIHLIYVDKKYQRQGVGRRIIDNLKDKAERINRACQTRAKFFNRIINERYFSIAVYPNLFDYLEGHEPDLEEWHTGDSSLDFTIEIDDDNVLRSVNGYYPADYYMRDETFDTGHFKPRLNQKELRSFYEGQGFVQCPEIQFKYPIKEGFVSRELAVGGRTICNLNRTPLIYPDNLDLIDIFRQEADKVINKTITEEEYKDFTENVISKLDLAVKDGRLVS